MKKKTTAILLAACLSTPMVSHTVSQNAAAEIAGGLTAWWVAEDYTNTNKGTSATWTDRVGGLVATGVAGNGVYPYINANGDGITFERSGDAKNSPGAHFSVAGNPIAGLTDFTILVDFTPSRSGINGGNRYYDESGFIGAEQGGVTYDWGFGYDESGHVVAGYGKATSDVTLDSKGTVAVGTQAVAGMTVSGTTLGSWINGELSNSATVTNNPRNNYTPMLIGRMAGNGGYAGDIGEIRVFNRALTAGEMATYSDMMSNDVTGHIWSSGTGNWTDAGWVTETGTTGALTANSHAFVRGGTMTMAAAPVIKSLTVGTGTAEGSAVVNADAATAVGAQTINVIAGGTLNLANVSTDVIVDGGTLTGLRTVSGPKDNIPTLTLNSGTITTNNAFDVGGTNNGLSGKLVINGGTLNTTKDYFCVGNRIGANGDGAGEVIQNGGTVTAAWLPIGYCTEGIYTLNSGTITATRITVGDDTINGVSGNGTFISNGGSITVNGDLNFGHAKAAAVGIGNFTNTTVSVSNVNIGRYGTGSLTLTNTKFTSKYYFTIADQASSIGTVEITGSTVTARDTLIANNKNTTGTLNFHSGTFTNTRNMNIGGQSGSVGTLNIENGSFSSAGWFSIADGAGSTGKVNVSGGNVTVQNFSTGNRGTGTYTQSAGFMTATNFWVGHNDANADGTVDLSGGVLKVTTSSQIGVTGKGTMTLSGSGVFNTPTLTNAQNLKFEGGTLMTNAVTGDLTQNGGTLVVGGNVEKGLSWTRQKWANVTDGFPGFTGVNTGYFVPTYEQIDAFWEKAQNATPVASGIGAVGSGLVNEEYFTVLYDGWIYVDKDDTYTISFNADDGGFVYVDGQKVAEMSSVQSNQPYGKDSVSTPIQLTEGWHHLDYRYYEGWGGQNINKAVMTDSSGNVTDLRDFSANQSAMMTYTPEFADMTIDGNYTLREEGNIIMEIDLTSGAHDSLVTTGDMDLDGILSIVVDGELSDTTEFKLFDTAEGQTMDFNFASIDFEGIFNDAYYWDLRGLMAGGDGILRFDRNSVPEPATWALLVLGACGLGILRRSARNKK